MKKKLMCITSTALMLTMLTSTVSAKEEVEKRTSQSPIPAIEQNPASLEASKETKEVTDLKLQVLLLENALAPVSSKDAINKWMKAIADHNGAYQYALFSENMREKSAKFFQENGWVTGYSSPWIGSSKVKKEKKVNSYTYSYTIEFSLYTSSGLYGKETAQVTVKKEKKNWYIDKVELQKGTTAGLNTPYVEQRYFTYRAAEYAFDIPVSWDKKYHVIEEKGNLIFNYKPKNKSMSQRPLFAIEKIKEDIWEKGGYSESLYVKLGLKDGYVYAMLPTSENQYATHPKSLEYKEFEEMSAQSKVIQNSFQFIY